MDAFNEHQHHLACNGCNQSLIAWLAVDHDTHSGPDHSDPMRIGQTVAPKSGPICGNLASMPYPHNEQGENQ